ncbi:trypsin-like peptidase domain-containing protein [Opitutus sp. ER46]|uniref:trypsin-like peptidase domain-containing protein n=1 Tax=Opitutus sp. ER46 TaxID=2161864 RepID=UPI001E5F4705|nr:trypsin-like peptidase domain-containing protein [Opitutus sp. ER46]
MKPFPARSIIARVRTVLPFLPLNGDQPRRSAPRAALGFLLLAVTLFAPAVAQAASMSRGFNRLLGAVVRIDVREVAFEAGVRRYSASIGSGVILTEDGLILTNAHVASPRAVDLSVTLANLERVNATLVGWDHWTDLAVLRLDLADVRKRNLTFAHARFGRSDRLYPGQEVFAVGTPHGLTRTVTRGIISNHARYFEDSAGVNGYETGAFNTWLQTDAAINPGNSGGPLVTEDGRVVGITSRGYLGANNLGFAIPASTAEEVLHLLARDGTITRSYIGLIPGALQDLENFYALDTNTGMLVNSVDPGSPAARAGIRAGDIVLTVNGNKVDGRFPEQLPGIQYLIARQPVGSTVTLVIKRGADTREVAVVTEKLESRVGEEWAFERWGLSVRKVSRAYARANQLEDDTGVVVIGVQSGFPADVATISRGDIITKVNHQPITSLAQLKAVHASYEAAPAPTLFEVQRDRRVSLFVVKP